MTCVTCYNTCTHIIIRIWLVNAMMKHNESSHLPRPSTCNLLPAPSHLMMWLRPQPLLHLRPLELLPWRPLWRTWRRFRDLSRRLSSLKFVAKSQILPVAASLSCRQHSTHAVTVSPHMIPAKRKAAALKGQCDSALMPAGAALPEILGPGTQTCDGASAGGA